MRFIGKELRHEDVKLCVRFLAEKGLLEEVTVGTSVAYRISPAGLEEFVNSRRLLSLVVFDSQ
jgi:hypothetical protein